MKYNLLIRNFNKTYKTIKLFTDEIKRTAMSALAGQTAFFIILSFFPFFMFLFALLRFTPFTEETFLEIMEVFIPSSFHGFFANTISEIYINQSASVISITIITAVWLGSKAFLSLTNGLNSIYEINETRNYVLIRIYSALYTVVFAFLIMATLTIMVFGNTIYFYVCQHFPMLDGLFRSIISLRPLVSFLIMFSFFTIMYKAIPNRKCSLSSQIPGALISTGGWIIFSYLYSFYVDHFSNYSAFYGTMSVIALLMVWLYACMYILFFGGMINNLLNKGHLQPEIGVGVKSN